MGNDQSIRILTGAEAGRRPEEAGPSRAGEGKGESS